MKINNGWKCLIYWFGLIVIKNNYFCWVFLLLDINLFYDYYILGFNSGDYINVYVFLSCIKV